MSDAAGVETHQRGARLKIVVIGGVAGGANFATRARRLSEAAEIVLIERGPYVSFANCGMPYHIGGEIPSRDDLLLQTPESLAQTFGLDVRIRHDAIRIDRHNKEVWIRNLATGESSRARPLARVSPDSRSSCKDAWRSWVPNPRFRYSMRIHGPGAK